MSSHIESQTKRIISEASAGAKIKNVNYTEEYGFSMEIEGAKYPYPGFPSPELIASVSLLKRTYIQFARIFSNWHFWPAYLTIWVRPTSFLIHILDSINKVGDTIIGQYTYYRHVRLTADAPHKDLSLLPTSREVEKLIKIFLEEMGCGVQSYWKKTIKEYSKVSSRTATAIAHIVEYDGAYRMRLQDFFSAYKKQDVLTRPITCLWQYKKTLPSREVDPQMVNKGRAVIIIAIGLLLVPKIRKAFRLALNQINYSDLSASIADEYWYLPKTDYNFEGRSFEERQDLIKHLGYSYPN